MKRVSMLAVIAVAVWTTLGVGVAFAETPLEERVTKLEQKVQALEATLKGVSQSGTLELYAVAASGAGWSTKAREGCWAG